jgi:ABC-type glycerol-3-phosphate transport system substrate-binding protein
MKGKKFLALLMAGAMTLSFAACGNNDEGENSSSPVGGENTQQESDPASGTPTPTDTPAPTEEPKSEGEKLAEQYNGFIETPMDLNGRVIKVLSTVADSRYVYKKDDNGNPSPEKTSNVTVEVIKALESIEKDYNCKFEFEQLKAKEMVSALVTAQSNGDVYCDILEFGCSDTYLEQIYGANLCMDLNDSRIADIIKLDENPWLPASGFGQFKGNWYGVHFKTQNSSDILRGVLLYNKELAAQYGLPDMYEMVKNGTFTFDAFGDMLASIQSQSDGSVYPFLFNQEGLFYPAMVAANGSTVATYENGVYTFNGLAAECLEALNYTVDWQNRGYYHPESNNRKTNEGNFSAGEAVFMVTNYATLSKLKAGGSLESQYTYGLLPMPIGPSNTAKQYNAVSYTEAMFNVMDNVEKPEEIAAVLVAIANRCSKHDMVDSELLAGNLMDNESGDMLQLMYDNMICDYSRSISTTRGKVSAACTSIYKGEKTPQVAFEEIKAEVDDLFKEYSVE